MATRDLAALALEYESVLKRSAGQLGLSLVEIEDFTEYFYSRARLVQIYFRWRPMFRTVRGSVVRYNRTHSSVRNRGSCALPFVT